MNTVGEGVQALPGSGPMAPANPPVAQLLAELQALQAAGAQRADPVRFHFLQALARRLPSAPPAVQRVLAARLAQALRTCAEQLPPPPAMPQPASPALATPLPRTARPEASPRQSPLATLTQALNDAHQAQGARADEGLELRWSGPSSTRPELDSVRRFRDTWSRIAAEAQVERAVGRGPENAGPLNSHLLVLRTLALMRDLSPDYLRRFLAQTDALLWLEQAQSRPRAAPTKPRPPRPPRQKKPAG